MEEKQLTLFQKDLLSYVCSDDCVCQHYKGTPSWKSRNNVWNYKPDEDSVISSDEWLRFLKTTVNDLGSFTVNYLTSSKGDEGVVINGIDLDHLVLKIVIPVNGEDDSILVEFSLRLSCSISEQDNFIWGNLYLKMNVFDPQTPDVVIRTDKCIGPGIALGPNLYNWLVSQTETILYNAGRSLDTNTIGERLIRANIMKELLEHYTIFPQEEEDGRVMEILHQKIDSVCKHSLETEAKNLLIDFIKDDIRFNTIASLY